MYWCRQDMHLFLVLFTEGFLSPHLICKYLLHNENKTSYSVQLESVTVIQKHILINTLTHSLSHTYRHRQLQSQSQTQPTRTKTVTATLTHTLLNTHTTYQNWWVPRSDHTRKTICAGSMRMASLMYVNVDGEAWTIQRGDDCVLHLFAD